MVHTSTHDFIVTVLVLHLKAVHMQLPLFGQVYLILWHLLGSQVPQVGGHAQALVNGHLGIKQLPDLPLIDLHQTEGSFGTVLGRELLPHLLQQLAHGAVFGDANGDGGHFVMLAVVEGDAVGHQPLKLREGEVDDLVVDHRLNQLPRNRDMEMRKA